ncbi:MAG: cold shock domain-containing protein, partial [Alphaproteobacteria bacterium]|nr:cold shock domain-containing protein [Alphaproteobacteria bacterium]
DVYKRQPQEVPQEFEVGKRFDGRCKWFNNRAGYGFVTASSGPNEGDDIFVHHSALTVDTEQYKYLVQGEYVELSVMAAEDDGNHKWQASDVRGVKGGKLMCETRNETREARNKADDGERRQGGNRRRQQRDGDEPREWNSRGPRRGGRGPRSVTDDNGVEWLLVRKGGGDRRGERRRQYDE